MAGKKYTPIHFPASEKVYVPGEMHKIHVGVRRVTLSDTKTVDSKGVELIKRNNPVILYDTTGPYSDPKITIDFKRGIPKIKEEWNIRRKDQVKLNNVYIAKNGKNITQLFYAKRRIITPEMEYVAIRENQLVEDLGLKSHITPDFVRKEIAAGRAVIPSNINHPEAEPMIIGRNFLVKVASRFPFEKDFSPKKEIEKIIWNCLWGSDLLIESAQSTHMVETRETVLRNSPIPYCAIPIFQALQETDSIDKLTWDIYRATLISQIEQGVDCIMIHAGILKKHLRQTSVRLTEINNKAGNILRDWMRRTNKENFLYTHFADICELLKQYDVTLILGSALQPGSLYDANDPLHFSELHVFGELTQKAKEYGIQIILEGSGHTPLNKTQEVIKEQQYVCRQTPILATSPFSTDIAHGYEHIASAIGAAHIAWMGTSLIADREPQTDKETIKNKLIAHKIAAHSADLAKGHPGSQIRDNALSKALFEGRRKDVNHLSLDSGRISKLI